MNLSLGIDKGKPSLADAVDGPLVVDDVQLLIRAATDGGGLTFLMEQHAAPYLASGAVSARRHTASPSATSDTLISTEEPNPASVARQARKTISRHSVTDTMWAVKSSETGW